MTRGAIVAITVAWLSGCGAQAAPPAKTPEAPAGAEPGSPVEERKADDTGPSEKGQDWSPPPPEQPKPAFDDDRRGDPALATLEQASAVFEQSLSRFHSALSSGRDCDVARKALASMERSQKRICDLNGASDPGDRCKTAQSRLEDARERVKRVCG